jgi:hypothetical protein
MIEDEMCVRCRERRASQTETERVTEDLDCALIALRDTMPEPDVDSIIEGPAGVRAFVARHPESNMRMHAREVRALLAWWDARKP